MDESIQQMFYLIFEKGSTAADQRFLSFSVPHHIFLGYFDQTNIVFDIKTT